MIDCVTNSKILRLSLDVSPKEDHEHIIKTEFDNMCQRFDLSESEMIALVCTQDIELLRVHYDTIWDGLNYYSMDCMDKFKQKYVSNVYKNNLQDGRIDLLCDDLQLYIKNGTCIGNNDFRCNTYSCAAKRRHDECIKYLIDNPKLHNYYNDSYVTLTALGVSKTNLFRHDFINPPVHWKYELHDTNLIDYMCICKCSLDVIKYAFEKIDCSHTTMSIDWASRNGNIDVVKYLFEIRNMDCTEDAIDWASEKGHLDIVKYLFEEQHKSCSTHAIDLACKMGHLDVVAYLFEVQHIICTKDAIEYACENGHLDVVAYLFEVQKKDCSDVSINNACKNGHLDVIKYLFEVQKKESYDMIIDSVCKNGHLDVVAYLFEVQKKNCTSLAIVWACENGHLDIVKYLIEVQNKNINDRAIKSCVNEEIKNYLKNIIK